MQKLGLIGWRGMVGSVLMERLAAENDLERVHSTYFTTSQAGQPAPAGASEALLQDAHNLDALRAMDIIISCQGGDYTKAVHGPLRASGWKGYWIDAASTLRMAPEATIILDPVNRAVIDQALTQGKKDFIGAVGHEHDLPCCQRCRRKKCARTAAGHGLSPRRRGR